MSEVAIIEAGDAAELDVMLTLADRELAFLRTHFAGCEDLAGTDSGAEFLETLDIAQLALARVRIERATPPGTDADASALHDAIAVMKRDES